MITNLAEGLVPGTRLNIRFDGAAGAVLPGYAVAMLVAASRTMIRRDAG